VRRQAGATEAGAGAAAEPVTTCARLLFTPTCVEATTSATTAALGTGAGAACAGAGGGCARAVEAGPATGHGGGAEALEAGGDVASMAGVEAEEGRRRRGEGGRGRAVWVKFHSRVAALTEYRACEFGPEPVYVQVGSRFEGWACKKI
jgi:hypothetical protein